MSKLLSLVVATLVVGSPLTGAGTAFGSNAPPRAGSAPVAVASAVVSFPDRVDYPTLAPPASSVGVRSVAVSDDYRGSRLIATTDTDDGVMVYESDLTGPVSSVSKQFPLLLPEGMSSATGLAFGPVLGHDRDDLVVVGSGELAVFPRQVQGGGLLNPFGFGKAIVTALTDGTNQRDVQLAALNGDQFLDAVIADGTPATGSESVTVLPGNGNGTFGPEQIISVGDDTGSADIVRVADLNNDHRADLVIGSGTCIDDQAEISVVLANATGGFGTPTQVGTPNSCLNTISLVITDLNGDHKPDIVEAQTCCFEDQIGSVITFLGTGTGTFAAGTSTSAPVEPVAVTAGDFNNDGHVDVAAVGQNGTDIFPGDGIGGLLPPQVLGIPSGRDYYGSATSTAATPVDLNSDGQPDLVVGNDAGISVADSSAVSPSAGPYIGGTTVDISGSGFTTASTVTFGGVAATAVTVVNADELSAVAPRIARSKASAVNISISGPGTMTAQQAFRYYVPQIGRLVNSEPSECTATVVASPHNDIVATAGHCVGGGGHLLSDFAFAPGYTGATCPAEIDLTDFFLCGDPPPFGVWTAKRVGTNNQWLNNGDHDLDYAFLAMNKSGDGQSIGRAVGGALPIQFNADRSQRWTAYGLAGGQTALQEVTGTETDQDTGSPGPANMTLPRQLGSGSSGGPWIGQTNGSVSAVNSTSDSGVVRGTYLGSEAQGTYNGM